MPFIYLVLLLPNMPEQVPMHFGFDGVADRYGSKYELFVLPAIGAFANLVFFLIGYASLKTASNHKEKAEAMSNRNVLIYVGIGLSALLNIMCLFSAYKGYVIEQGIYESFVFDINQLICFSMGMLFVLFGIIIPKSKMNSYIGIRTTKSMENDQIWSKVQKKSGRRMTVIGILMIVGSLFLNGTWAMILMLLGILGLITCVVIPKTAKNDE